LIQNYTERHGINLRNLSCTSSILTLFQVYIALLGNLNAILEYLPQKCKHNALDNLAVPNFTSANKSQNNTGFQPTTCNLIKPSICVPYNEKNFYVVQLLYSSYMKINTRIIICCTFWDNSDLVFVFYFWI